MDESKLKLKWVVKGSNWAIGALFLLGVIYQFRFFYPTAEDSWISLKYALNLAQGKGLVTNSLGRHEEGFSNLLLVLMVAGLGRLGFDFLLATKCIGILAVAGTGYLIIKLGREHFLLQQKGDSFIFTALSAFFFAPATVYWSAAGLETTLYGALLTLNLYFILCYLRTNSRKYLLVIPLTFFFELMTRPESPIFLFYNAGAVFLVSFHRWQLGIHRSFKRAGFVLLSGGALIFLQLAWRLTYFDETFSNPAMVKLALSIWDPIANRISYILNFVIAQSSLHVITALVTSAFLFWRKAWVRALDRLAILITLGFIGAEGLFVLMAGTDYMPNYRFMAPVTSHLAIICAVGVTLINNHIIPVDLGRRLFTVGASLGFIFAGVSSVPNKHRWWNQKFAVPKASDPAYGPLNYMNNVDSIRNKLTTLGSSTYAHSEFGYIPYHLPEFSGIDMMGLNNKVVAKTFATYPIHEASAAARDYVLSQLPGVISTCCYYQDKLGIHTKPGVAWFFDAYLASEFFRSHYEIEYGPNDHYDRWLVNFRKPNFKGTATLDSNILLSDKTHRSKLMQGFYLEEGKQIWVAPKARVLLTREHQQDFIRVSGYVPNLDKYESKSFHLKVATTEKFVGDRKVGLIQVNESGTFNARLSLPDSAKEKMHILVDLRGSRLRTDAKDMRELSWIFKTVALE